MKNHSVKQFGLFLFFALAACSAPDGEGGHRDPLTFQGASADDLIKSLGQPQAQDRLATGERVLQYTWTNTYVAGGYTTTPGGGIYSGSNWNLPRTYEPTRTVALACVVRFTIGTDNRVSEVNSHGDGC